MKVLILFTLILSGQIYSQSEKIKRFFTALINDPENITEYINEEELAKSLRLGISFEEVDNKFLISFDIDDSIKNKINNNDLSYELREEKQEEGFSRILFNIPGSGYSKYFYFKNDLLIFPSTYYTKNWQQDTSGFYRFSISDPDLFNDYSIAALDSFAEVMLDLLQVGEQERLLLQKEKINYILCRDNNEIKAITGFDTRGIYLLANDEIVTTYNCHFHEIAHLLVNYKLKGLPLYTLPFLQEGFATLTGGRGGLGRNVLLDTGWFLQKSGFIPFNSIVTKDSFLSEDASVTYPVAALYSSFLMESFGINSYLELYKTYSGTAGYVAGLKTEDIKFPSADSFNAYINKYEFKAGISLQAEEEFKPVPGKEGILESDNYYMIKLRSNMLLRTPDPAEDYTSKKFNEVFPGIGYDGSKYLIRGNSREINIYNLYTNNLIASYAAGFSIGNKEVPVEEGFFVFYVRKDVFDEEIEDLGIREI